MSCTYPLDGNCWCFNTALAIHRTSSTAELLEALEEARAVIGCIEQSADNCWRLNAPDPETVVCHVAESIDAAIARARGQ